MSFKAFFYLLGVMIIPLMAFYVVAEKVESKLVDLSPDLSGEIQEVVISIKNFDYFPKVIELRQGVPVKLTLDKSVYGCFRDFSIRDFGIRKYLPNESDYISFTPLVKGDYSFSCGMGMGNGVFKVI